MMTIYGKQTNAIVYADILDDKTKEQIKTLVDQDFMKDIKVRIMADCHAGAGCVIGTTVEISNGEKAVVISQTDDPKNPIVLIPEDEKKKKHNLMLEKDISILHIV